MQLTATAPDALASGVEKLAPLRGAADLVQNEGTGQPVDENRLGRANEKHVSRHMEHGLPPFGRESNPGFCTAQQPAASHHHPDGMFDEQRKCF
jgi:hypothetical protein